MSSNFLFLFSTAAFMHATPVASMTWRKLLSPDGFDDPPDGSIACVVCKKAKTRKRCMRRGEARKREREEKSQKMTRHRMGMGLDGRETENLKWETGRRNERRSKRAGNIQSLPLGLLLRVLF